MLPTTMEFEQPALVRTASRTSIASLIKEKVADPETQIAKDAASDAYLSAQDPEDAPSMLDRLYARFPGEPQCEVDSP